MRKMLGLILNTSLAASSLASASAQVPVPRDVSSLCDELAQLAAGETVNVTLSGVYEVSSERQFFYDPAARQCEYDVKPAVWIEFTPGFAADETLKRLLDRHRRAYITLRGQLEGPPPIGPDDESYPLIAAFANRTAQRRYGHLGMFRAQLIVREVLAFSEVPPSVPTWAQSTPPPVVSTVPTLLAAQVPEYPHMALWAGLMGTVVVDIRVEGGAVTSAVVVAGDRMLAPSVLANIATWRFAGDVEATFTTTFVYEVALRRTGDDKNVRYELRLPLYAKISGPARGW